MSRCESSSGQELLSAGIYYDNISTTGAKMYFLHSFQSPDLGVFDMEVLITISELTARFMSEFMEPLL
jgi:hypothetical protein